MPVAVSFGLPIALLLLAAVPALLWLARGRLAGFDSRQRRWAFALRGLLFTALVLTLADPRLGRPDDRLSVVLAIDDSASIQAPQRALQQAWLDQARQSARPDDRVAVVHFGRWAAPADGPGARQPVPPDATNLADALELSGSLLGESGHRRVVLLTDGQQNVGRAQEVAADLAGRGVEVSFAPPEPPVAYADVVLRGLDGPAYLRQGETLQVDALVQSNVATSATLRLYLDDRQVGEQTIQLKGGAERVPLVARPDSLGYHVLRAEIAAPDDAVPDNNTVQAYTVVKPTGRVLLLESRPGEAQQLDQALRASGLQTEVRPASAVPPSAASMQGYDSAVLVNVPSTALKLDQQTTLQSFVQDYGRGLVVVGGNTSYSLGAYGNSPLGDLLPVDPTPPTRRERGNVALFLVIDKSGSMDLYRNDVSKMAMAREAAILATEALNVDDQVGVIAFDARYQWVVPPTRLAGPADVAAVKSRIASIQADGSTNIFPALEAAYQAAQASTAKLKHIILLTDGQSADGDYASLIARMKPANITLTTVGVGSDTDAALLTRLALLGDGRYYSTERPQEIPKIVTRETTIVSRNPLVQGVIRPVLTEPSPLLADLNGQALPTLNGYVATSPRPRAHTILSTDGGDPLLATWQFGLGRVVAWTSDASSTWAGPWFDSPDAQRVWGQAVRWSMPPPTDPGFQLTTSVDGDRVRVAVQAADPDGRFSDGRAIQATVVGPGGRAFQVPLRQTGPGHYEVTVQAPRAGAYAVTASEARNGAAVRSEEGGFVVTAVPELRAVGANRPLLEQLAQVTGGRELTDPREAFDRNAAWVETTWIPLWPWLLGLALVLLPLDVAARRFVIRR